MPYQHGGPGGLLGALILLQQGRILVRHEVLYRDKQEEDGGKKQ